MANNLVLVESPAKAKTISKLLGKDFKVTATFGHIIDLPEYRLGVNIKGGFQPLYIVLPKRKKIMKEIENNAKKSSKVFVATDPDREGEAIGWLVKEFLVKDGIDNEKFCRVEFHEITPSAIKKAFSSPRGFNDALVEAQQTRRILDRIVGYYLSPLLWKGISRGLSAGRVQSVALRLIVERERQIRAFVPQEYWEICADFKKKDVRLNEFKLAKIKGKKVEISSQEEANKIKERLEGLVYVIDLVERKEKRKNPPAPFITSTLQQAAFNKLKFPAAKTMQIAQQLYEGIDLGEDESIGLITYMRTDSVNIAKDAINEVRNFIREEIGEKYLPKSPNIYRSRKEAQQAHEAIRPTSVFRRPESIKKYLTQDQFRLYQLIWQRFVASQMTAAVFDNLTVVICDKDKEFEFRKTFSILKEEGFMKIYSEEEEERLLEFPEVESGQDVDIEKIELSQHFTKPPARFNDASLVRELEEKGIGRPSTYAPTIQTLLLRGYVRRDKRMLVPTELGEKVVDLLMEKFPEIMDYEFTAKMEEDLDKIEERKARKEDILGRFYQPFAEKVSNVSKGLKKDVEESDEICEKCGSKMVVRWGKTGKFLSCSNYPECKNAKPLPVEGVICPKCGGKIYPIVYKKGKRRKIFYGCSNYPKCDFSAATLSQLKRIAKVEEDIDVK